MDARELDCHLQMLKEVACYEGSEKLFPYFEETVAALISYIGEAVLNWKDVGERAVAERDLDFHDEAQVIETYALLKVFSFVDCDKLLGVLRLIYYPIIPRDFSTIERVISLCIAVFGVAIKDTSSIN